MSRTSCIRHPDNDKLIQVRQWQIEACEGNHCAAFILAYFEYWTNTYHAFSEKSKLYRSMTVHSDKRRELHFSEDGTPIIPFSYDEITDGMLGLFSRRTVVPAVDYLFQRQFLIFHNIPVYFDRIKYYSLNINALHTFIDNFYGSAKLHDGKCKIARCNSAKLHDEYIGKENKGEYKENKENSATPVFLEDKKIKTDFLPHEELFENLITHYDLHGEKRVELLKGALIDPTLLDDTKFALVLKEFARYQFSRKKVNTGTGLVQNVPELERWLGWKREEIKTGYFFEKMGTSFTNQKFQSHANSNSDSKNNNSGGGRRGVRYTERLDEFIEAATSTGGHEQTGSGFSIFSDNQ